MADMPAQLDLKKAHLHRVHGDLLAVYTWINDERALVLIPHLRPGAPWFVVADSAAWKYNDPAYMAQQCALACDVLGIEASRANWVRVAGIINDGLPDLITMPSAPATEYYSGAVGQMRLKADGQDAAAEDIRIARTGATYG